MGIKTSSVFVLLVLGALAIASPRSTAQNSQAPWQVGQPAPRLHLPAIGTDELHSLEDYRGQRILLIEFASW